MKGYSRLVGMLSSEFNRYLMGNPEASQTLPGKALVIFNIRGEEEFNRWSEEMALRNREESQPLVYVTVTAWRETPAWEKVEVNEVLEIS